MSSPAFLITAFWSLCLAVGAWLVHDGINGAWTFICLFLIAIFQAVAVRPRR